MAGAAKSLQDETVLSGSARRHFHHGAMPLGVRTFFGGTAHYRTERGAYAVDEGAWFVINAGQPYAITIDSPHLVRSCVVFFPDHWAHEVARTFAESTQTLLEAPESTPPAVNFFETVCDADALVLPRLHALDRACRGRRVADAWLEEQLRDLLAALVLSQRDHARAADRLTAARAPTRQELHRRLCRGRDYLRANANSAPTLGDAARAASLSPFHFQRSFSRVFGESPHVFTTRCRLLRARQMIVQTRDPITEIAAISGYDSFSAFSRAFRHMFGVAPSVFRKN